MHIPVSFCTIGFKVWGLGFRVLGRGRVLLPLAQASSAHLLTMGISITLLTPQTGTAKQGLPVMQARPGSLPLAQPSAAADAASAAGGGLLAPAVLQGLLLDIDPKANEP